MINALVLRNQPIENTICIGMVMHDFHKMVHGLNQALFGTKISKT